MSTRRTPRPRTWEERAGTEPRPAAEIRRFDVFAEWNRLKAIEDLKLTPADAKAYGLAVAKVVAGRRGMPGEVRPAPAPADRHHARAGHPREGAWWRRFGSAREFDGVIVGRMGREFYRSAFRPALRRAWERGLEYTGIRDSIRDDWNRRRPARE